MKENIENVANENEGSRNVMKRKSIKRKRKRRRKMKAKAENNRKQHQ
jgi:hypothetical protein